MSEVIKIPYSTVERLFKEITSKLAPLTEQAALEIAKESTKLILGIDDFAIRKGHNYNTGIHDLRGEVFLGIIKGRTLEELREFTKENLAFSELNPAAVVMDLAKHYHSFVTEVFPNAVRIADRFHVNRYILDALNNVRKRIEKDLPSKVKQVLKRNKHLLNKRGEDLSFHERASLNNLLKLSPDLKSVYELKEKLIDWYDCSSNHKVAVETFEKFCAYGHSLNIPEVNKALKTFENWKVEICNYHIFPFTNAVAEGRNGKIKSIQRRRFFLRNRTFYESIIMLECNKEIYSRLII